MGPWHASAVRGLKVETAAKPPAQARAEKGENEKFCHDRSSTTRRFQQPLLRRTPAPDAG